MSIAYMTNYKSLLNTKDQFNSQNQVGLQQKNLKIEIGTIVVEWQWEAA